MNRIKPWPHSPAVLVRVEGYAGRTFPMAGAALYEVHLGGERDVAFSYDEAQRAAERMKLEQSDPDPVEPILGFGGEDRCMTEDRLYGDDQ